MSSLKLTDVTRAVSAAKTFAKKTDLDKDGVVNGSERNALTQHLTSTRQPATPTVGVNALMAWSKKKYNDTKVTDLFASADELGRRLKAADSDGDGVLSDAEQRKLRTNGEKQLLQFAQEMKGKKVADFDLDVPAPVERPGFFDYRGTPSQVCESLLKARSRKSNDNFWPSWSGLKTPARYVLDATEAKSMVAALEPLSTSKQQAVLRELSRRTQSREPGCVSPDTKAQKVLKTYATSLGLSLPFNGPTTAPKMPSP